jgi:hypothetical protein
MTFGALKRRYPTTTQRLVLITEVTRMRRGYLCVAGWDIQSAKMVRPLQPGGDNWQLLNNRLPFQVGELVRCTESPRVGGHFPHATEDMVLKRSPEQLEVFAEAVTYELVKPTVDQSIRKIFGQPLLEDKYLNDGIKTRSLGAVLVPRKKLNFVESFGKLRVHLVDADRVAYDLPVTSEALLRFFAPDIEQQLEPHFGVAEANKFLRANEPDELIIARVGLSRGWDGPAKDWKPKRCYLQLNGIICPKDNWCIFD